MVESIIELKKKRGSQKDRLEKFKEKLESKKSNFNADERFWKPTQKNGKATALIRFLDAPKGEEDEYVLVYYHFFKNRKNGKSYVEDCPSTIPGLPCPVCEENSRLCGENEKYVKQLQAENRFRKKKYISNILVIEDKANPDAEGKVFLYQFGQKIFDMIVSISSPQFDDMEACLPFDFWEGANFRLRTSGQKRDTDYSLSEFVKPSPLFKGNDEKIEEAWGKCYPLSPFISKDVFKEYDVLGARLNTVLHSVATPKRKKAEEEESLETEEIEDTAEEAEEKEEKKSAKIKPLEIEEDDDSFDDDDNLEAELAAMAAEE